jgi:GAF domain-containing protein/nitrogen-specific signal transduction histidine kinase
MDLTIAPPAASWELLADLAAFGQESTQLRDEVLFAERLAKQVRARLMAPWGAVLMYTPTGPIIEEWGLEAHQRTQLLTDGENYTALDGCFIPFDHGQAPAGMLVLGRTPALETLQSSGFLEALRRQLELLETVRRRETEHWQRENAARLSMELFATLDLSDVLRSLAVRSVLISGSRASAVFFVGEHGLEWTIGHGLQRDYPGVILQNGECLAGQVAQHQVSLTVEDYRNYEHRAPVFTDENWGPTLAVPLLAQGALIGVLMMMRAPYQPRFTEQDRRQLEAFAQPAALVLRNAQLFSQQHQRARELFVLYENSQILSSGRPSELLLTRVVENVTAAMGADRAVLHLIDRKAPTFLVEAAAYNSDGSDERGSLRYSIDAYPELTALLNNGSLLSVGPETNTRPELQRILGSERGIFLPLRSHLMTLGLLGIGSNRQHTLSALELNLARTFASQVATALVNTQLSATEQQRSDDLEKLHSISQKLGEAISIDQVLRQILDGTRQLVPCVAAQVSLIDPIDQQLRGMHHIGPTPLAPATADIAVGDTVSNWIVRYQKPLLLDSYQTAPVRPLVTTLSDGRLIEGYLGLPLSIGERLIGVLELFSDRFGAFTEAHQQLLRIIAGPFAQTISAIRPHTFQSDQLRRRLEQQVALQRVSRELTSTLSLDLILSVALEEALRVTPAEQALIVLRTGTDDDLAVTDAATGELLGYVSLKESSTEPRYSVFFAEGYGNEGLQRQLIGRELPQHTFIASEALERAQEMLADELYHDDRLVPDVPAVASALAVPIFFEDQVIGALNLHSPTSHAFTGDMIDFVRALADQASLALNNAYRYDEQRHQRRMLQQRVHLLSEVLTIGQAMRADRSLEEILEQIAFSVIESANFRIVAFYVVDPDNAEWVRWVSGAGLPLTENERVQQQRMPIELLNRMLNKRFRLSRSFYVPAFEGRQFAEDVGVALDDFFPVVIDEERPNHEWQAGDLLLVPLYSTSAQLIGVMVVDDPFNRQRPHERMVGSLEIFSDQAALAIENAYLLRSATRQTEQMVALYRVSNAATATLELDSLLEGVYNEIVAYMGEPSFFFVASYDAAQNQLRFEHFREEGALLTRLHKTLLAKGGLSGWIIDHGQMLQINDYPAEEEHLPVKATMLGRPIRSWIGIPLRSHSQTIGVLSVQSVEPYAFETRHVQFLSTLANQLSVALDNVTLFHERERRIKELNIINQIAQITSSTLDIRQAMELVYDCLVAYLPIDAGFISVYRVVSNEPGLMFAVDGGQRFFQGIPENPSPGSLTEQIVRTRQPLLFQDIVKETQTRSELLPVAFGDEERESAAWLGVPLLLGDEVLGVLSIQSYTPGLYGQREVSFLMTVARQLVLGVQNARLFAERERQIDDLDAIAQVGRVTTSTIELRTMIEEVILVLQKTLPIDQIAIAIINRQVGRMTITSASHSSTPHRTQYNLLPEQKAGTLIEWVVLHGQSLRVTAETPPTNNDVTQLLAEQPVESFLGVPILDRTGGCIGAITITNQRLNAFSERDESFLNGVSGQVSLGVLNARLFAQTQEQIDQLNQLNQVASVAATALDQQEILQAAVNTMVRITGTDQGRLAIWDRERGYATIAVEAKPTDFGKAVTIPLLESPQIEWIDQNRRPLFVYDAQNDPILRDVHHIMQAEDIRSLLIVPLIINDRVIGSIGLDVQGRQLQINERAIEFCQTISAQAATALERTRLFNTAQQNALALQGKVGELSTLLRAVQVLSSSLKPREVLDKLMAIVGEQLQVDTVALWTVQPDQHLIPEAMLNIPPNEAQTMRVPVGQGLTGKVVTAKKPIVIADVEANGRSLYPTFQRAHRLSSFMGVQVRYQGEVIGVLSVMTVAQRQFTDDEVMLLSGLADQAAIALENARRFEEREQKIDELMIFNELGQELRANNRTDDILDLLYRQTTRLFNNDNFFVALHDERHSNVSFPIFYERGKRLMLAPLQVDHSPFHQVIAQRVPLVLQHTQLTQTNRDFDLAALYTGGVAPKAWLGVPLIAGHVTIGVIGLQDFERDNAFTPDKIRLLTTIADWGATALENAHLLSETQRGYKELETLYDISLELTGTLEIEGIQEIVVSNTLQLLNADVGAVILFDEQRGQTRPYVLHRTSDQDDDNVFVDFVGQLVDILVERDRPLVVDDVTIEPRIRDLNANGYRSLLGTLIGPHENPIGVLWVGCKTTRDWQREISLMSILSTLLKQALESARLFESEQTRRRAADTLREVAAIFTSVLEPEQITSLILEQLARVVPYRTASLLLRDGDMLQIAASRGFDSQRSAQLSQLRFSMSGGSHLLQIAQTRKPLVLADAQQAPEWEVFPGSEHIHGWIGAPLLLEDEVIGILAVDSDSVGAYGDDEAQLAFALASQAAQALNNAQQFAERKRFTAMLEQRVEERTAELRDEQERLQTLHTIALQLTASTDLDEVLAQTLLLVSRAVGANRGSIMLRDIRSNQIVCRAVLTVDGDAISTAIPINFEQGPGLVGWVVNNQQPLIVDDVRHDPRWLQEEGRASEARSVAAVPLMSSDGPLGVLMLVSSRVNYFDQGQLELLTTIANEMAIVIQNVNLYSYITEKAEELAKSVEQQREETSKTQAILQSLGEGVIVLDEERRVILFNPAVEQMLGIPGSYVQQNNLAALMHFSSGTANERAQTIYTALVEGLRATETENKPHSRLVELAFPTQSIALNFGQVISPSGTYYGNVVVLRDITREIESDNAKRNFISTVSHELRTPLTAIKGYIDLLRLGTGGQLNEAQLTYVNTIKTNGDRLLDLIGDLLEIGQIDAQKLQLTFETIDAKIILEDVVRTMKALADKKQLTVATAIQPDLPLIQADKKRLSQVILNLVSNAIKYTFEQGRVEVKAYLNPAGLLQLDVSDSGVGISPEDQKKLFRRFFRADNPLRDTAGGTGLGLSIAKSYIELHGGEMWVKSTLGEGSTFSFVIPVSQQL